MVLESLIGPAKAEKKPWDLFFLGILYSTIAIFLSLWIFRDQSSLIMVFLTVMAAIPLVYKTMKYEEKKNFREIRLLKEHTRALVFLTALFLGILFSFSLWYVFLPGSLVEPLFSIQTQTIKAINAQISAIQGFSISWNTIDVTGSISQSSLFSQILLNNIKVLLFCIFFSFFYGAGAIFILTWNASVISAAIGSYIRNNIATVTGLSYFSVVTTGIMRYMTHGIFEIFAYFIGGLAGGIISIAVIRHEFFSSKFKKVMVDSIDLFLIAVALLFIGAYVEVYVTPLIFA